MVIAGTGCVLKVLPGSPASVNSFHSLLEKDAKPLIALWLCASWPTLISLATQTYIQYAYELLSCMRNSAQGICAEKMLQLYLL